MSRIFNKKIMKDRRRQLRTDPTLAESVLWEKLRNKQVEGLRFRRQVSIGAFVVDFYAPSIKLAIELDGSIHNLQEKYDDFRQSGIETIGIRFLRFTNEQVFEDIESVIQEIKDAMQNAPLS